MANREVKQLEWTCQKNEKSQNHVAHLVEDQSTADLFKAVANLLEDLNNQTIQPEFPSQLFHQSLRSVQAFELDRQYRFIALKDKDQVATLLLPVVTITEYEGSQTPEGGILGVSGSDYKTAFEIFGLEIDENQDLVAGYLIKEGDVWFLKSVFDRNGWGFDEYIERLRNLGCQVK